MGAVVWYNGSIMDRKDIVDENGRLKLIPKTNFKEFTPEMDTVFMKFVEKCIPMLDDLERDVKIMMDEESVEGQKQ